MNDEHHEPTGQETIDGPLGGHPSASGTWNAKQMADAAHGGQGQAQAHQGGTAEDAALRDKERRKKAYILIAIGAGVVVLFILSSIGRHRSAKTRSEAPDAFSHTPPSQTKTPTLPFFAQSPPGKPAAAGTPYGGGMAGGQAEDPELAALHRQAAVLQAIAAVRQAQYQVTNLRINPAQKADEPLSVTFAGATTAPAHDASTPARQGAQVDDNADSFAAVTETEKGDSGRQSVIRAGTLLDAVLINKLVTDNYTSPVICLVDRAYYDPATKKLLIPAGTKILGKAEAVKFQTASRLAITFDTFQFPNGRTFSIKPDEQALEGLGVFGLADKVNRHTARILFTAGLIGILTGWNTSQTNTNTYGQMSGEDQVRLQASASLSRTGEQLLSPFLNAVPTITVNEGHRLKIFISRDLPIDNYQGASYE